MYRKREEIAQEITKFLNGDGRACDWDDFISFKIDEPELEEIRSLCVRPPDLYPPDTKGYYCAEEGLRVLTELRDKLLAK